MAFVCKVGDLFMYMCVCVCVCVCLHDSDGRCSSVSRDMVQVDSRRCGFGEHQVRFPTIACISLLWTKWFLVRKPEGMRPLGRPGRRWEDNIKIGLHEVGWWGMDWIGMARDRGWWRALVNALLNQRGPQNAGNFLNS
jgi:hypothetical protein